MMNSACGVYYQPDILEAAEQDAGQYPIPPGEVEVLRVLQGHLGGYLPYRLRGRVRLVCDFCLKFCDCHPMEDV